jgi:hypothetical protein
MMVYSMDPMGIHNLHGNSLPHKIHVWYIYANIWGIWRVNVTIYSMHGTYGMISKTSKFHVPEERFVKLGCRID